MSIFDQLKAKAQGFGKTAGEQVQSLSKSGSALAQTGAVKARQVAELAKLKAANLSEQETIRRAYTELGKLYYERCGQAPEVEYLSLCASITEAKAKVAMNEDKMKELAAEIAETKPVVIVPEAEKPAASAAEEPVEVPAEEPVVETPAEEHSAATEDIFADLDAFIQKNAENTEEQQ